ncbi:signal peptidase II [Cohnella pontilimi]|uniref:Lipoprotein signal peptidase n=1 Tax=Cohnella pontilimi TaxID=2564100 RepID=A0A4U0F8K5_9BACL|nr:signal peptidase II [Cohnella pontilimi]TJY41066.1 signal peptidase II [Cohnella pontilimi]
MMFFLTALTVLAIDQATKIAVRLHMKVGNSVPVWDEVLQFTRYENSGIARGMLQGYGRLSVPIAVFVTVMILYYRKKGLLNSSAQQIGAALLVGGALGNAIDRLLYNQVTDFIAFTFMDGILNVADYAIQFGILLIIAGMLREEWRSRKQARSKEH